MKAIECPECKKAIGEYVYMKSIDSGIGFVGKMPVYEMKYDYRKASHIHFGKGLLCKKCARKYFPLGVAYKVTNDYHGKRITPFVGPWRCGLFADRAEAQRSADECNRRNNSNQSRVEEIKL